MSGMPKKYFRLLKFVFEKVLRTLTQENMSSFQKFLTSVLPMQLVDVPNTRTKSLIINYIFRRTLCKNYDKH